VVEGEEEEDMADQEQCTRKLVQIVARKRKSLSNQREIGQSIVEIASRSIEGETKSMKEMPSNLKDNMSI